MKSHSNNDALASKHTLKFIPINQRLKFFPPTNGDVNGRQRRGNRLSLLIDDPKDCIPNLAKSAEGKVSYCDTKLLPNTSLDP